MNVNSPEGRRARLEMWKSATGMSVWDFTRNLIHYEYRVLVCAIRN